MICRRTTAHPMSDGAPAQLRCPTGASYCRPCLSFPKSPADIMNELGHTFQAGGDTPSPGRDPPDLSQPSQRRCAKPAGGA